MYEEEKGKKKGLEELVMGGYAHLFLMGGYAHLLFFKKKNQQGKKKLY